MGAQGAVTVFYEGPRNEGLGENPWRHTPDRRKLIPLNMRLTVHNTSHISVNRIEYIRVYKPNLMVCDLNTWLNYMSDVW